MHVEVKSSRPQIGLSPKSFFCRTHFNRLEPELDALIHETAQYIARNGLEFEARMQDSQRDNVMFAFLFPHSEWHGYFHDVLRTIRHELDPGLPPPPPQHYNQQMHHHHHHHPHIAPPPPPFHMHAAPPPPGVGPLTQRELDDFAHMLHNALPSQEAISVCLRCQFFSSSDFSSYHSAPVNGLFNAPPMLPN